MRKRFFQELYELMKQNDKIVALTGDLGYGGFDAIRQDFPDRFINCGASEFAMVGIACGLALEGKIPVVYSITPFLLYRPFEMIRTYVDHEQIPVKLVGSGRDDDYKHDGYSHDATDVMGILSSLKYIKQYYPPDSDAMVINLTELLENDRPCFLSLKR